ncbi:MAG: hypothetical protein JSV49_06655, partial [Thermoplasmata archaeon]
MRIKNIFTGLFIFIMVGILFFNSIQPSSDSTARDLTLTDEIVMESQVDKSQTDIKLIDPCNKNNDEGSPRCSGYQQNFKNTRSTDPYRVKKDWYIDVQWHYTNMTYIVQGNITIGNLGKLTLINSTIIFDSTDKVTYGLYIEDNGALVTSDLDNDPTTTSDFSVIRSNITEDGTSNQFRFHAKSGSSL